MQEPVHLAKVAQLVQGQGGHAVDELRVRRTARDHGLHRGRRAQLAMRVVGALKQHGYKDLLGEEMEWTGSQAVGPDSSLANPEAFLKKVLAGLNQLPA